MGTDQKLRGEKSNKLEERFIPLSHLSEHDVEAVEPGGLRRCHEELAAVRVWPAICHGQEART